MYKKLFLIVLFFALAQNAAAANFLRNQSFEIGNGAFEVDRPVVNTGSSALFWANSGDFSRSSAKAYSGSWSMKCFTAGGVSTVISDLIYVETNTEYKVSGRIYNSLASGSAYIDLNDAAGEPSLVSSLGNNSWEYLEGAWNSGVSSSVRVRCITDNGPAGTTWFDDLKFERIPCFVTTSGCDFYYNGRKWYPYGINYWPRNCVSTMYGPWLDTSGHYDRAEIEKDLMAISRMGMNMVSIQSGSPFDEIAPNLLDFLELCDRYCVKVNLFVTNLSPMSPNLDPNSALDFIRKYNLGENDAVFTYDISWEPSFGSADGFAYPGPSPRGNWDSEWRDWIIESYGSVSAAESLLGALNTTSNNQFGAGVVSQNIPSRMAAGQAYDISVTMKNIGTGTWSQANGYKLARLNFYPGFGYVSKMGPSDVSLGPADSIAQGGSKTFNFTITAPSTPGRYVVAYKMLASNYSINYFWGWLGGTCYKWVDVVPSGTAIQEMTTYEKVITSPTDAEAMSGGSSAKVAAYRHFVDELLSRDCGFIIRQVKEIAPDQLVSFRQNSYGRDQFAMTFDFKATSVWNDFTQPEAYTAYNGDTLTWRKTGFDTIYARFAGGGNRPVWWSEGGYNLFGYSGNPPPVEAFNYGWGQYRKWWIALKEACANGVAPWWFPGGWRAKDRPPTYEENSDFGLVSETCVLRKACAVIIENSVTLTTPRDYTNPNSFITIDRDSRADGYAGIYSLRAGDYVSARDAGNTPSVRTTGTGTNSKNTPLERIGNVAAGPPKYLKAEFVYIKIKDAHNAWVEAHDNEIVDVLFNSPIYVSAKAVNTGEAEWYNYSSAPAGENGSVKFAGNENLGNINFRQELPCQVPYLSRIEIPQFSITNGITTESTVVFQMVAEQRSWFGDQVKVRLHPVSDPAGSGAFSNSFLGIKALSVPADGTNKCTVAATLLTEAGIPRPGMSVSLSSTGHSSYDNITQPSVTDANGMCTGYFSSAYAGASNIYATVSGETNIYQNLVLNPSFEFGFAGWEQNSSVQDSNIKYSGNSSARLSSGSAQATGCISNTVAIDNNPGVSYRMSLYCRTIVSTPGFCVTAFYYRDDSSACSLVYENIIEIGNTDEWRKWSVTVGGTGSGAYFILPADCSSVRIGARWSGVSGAPSGTGWIDAVRIERAPSVIWAAVSLAFISLPVSVTKGNPSPQITIEARGSSGGAPDSSFNDTCVLSSSSAGGSFSVSGAVWQDTTVVYFSSGSAVFFYRDTSVGNPVISVSRQGFSGASQQGSILLPFADPCVSRLTVGRASPVANSIDSASVVVTVNDSYNYPIAGKLVSVYTSRQDSDTIKDSAGNIVSSFMTGASGQCTAYVSSVYSGGLYVYAFCDGATITENIVPNPSFEDGSGPDASGWARDDNDNFARTSEKTHSGNYSLRLRSTWGKAITTKYMKVAPDSVYKISAWMYNSLGGSYSQYVDLNDALNDINMNSTRGLNSWEYKEANWPSSSYTQVYMRTVLGDAVAPVGTCWFDDIRMSRVPTLSFIGAPVRLKIVSGPFSVSRINPALISVEAWDNANVRTSAYNDSAQFSTTSAGGSFSLDKNSWSASLGVVMSEGAASCYYKDTLAGTPVITVTAYSLASDSQAETITDALVGSTSSRIYAFPGSAKADGIETVNVSAAMNDIYGFPVAGQPVTLYRTDARTQVQANPLTTDANGMCTFTVSSSYAGINSLSAQCADGTATYMLYDDFLSYAEGSSASQAWKNIGGTWQVNSGEFAQTYSGGGIVTAGGSQWSDFTLEVRMKTDAPGANSWDTGRIIFRQTPFQSDYDYYFILMHTNGTVEYGVSRPSMPGQDNPSGWYSNRTNVSTAASPFVWHNFKIAVTGSGPVKIDVYMDSSLVFTKNETEDTFIIPAGKIALQAATCLARFDDVKVYPCVVEFTGYRAGLITDPFRKPAGAVSPQLTIAACGALGGIDVSYNTSVVLATSSSSGAFSATSSGPWTNPKTFWLSSGKAACYYRDQKINNPVIKVITVGSALFGSTQTETITASVISIPYFSIRTSETSALVTASAGGLDGETDTGFSETMGISSSSPSGRFSISSTAWRDTSVLRFSQNLAYFYYRDKRGGSPLIIFSNPDLGMLYDFRIDVTIPEIRLFVTARKQGSETGTLIAVSQGDTIEYEIDAANTGNETASGVTITDTTLFDTLHFIPLAFISMDTSCADSWAYKNSSGAWLAWGIAPAYNSNIKGLRWFISTLGIGETRVLKFRVRIK